MKPDPKPRIATRASTDESQHFVSTTLIRVRGTQRMGGWAQVYRDVWTSEEFIGRPTVDANGRRTRTKPLGRAGLAVYVYLATHTSGAAGTCHSEEDVSQARMSEQLGMSPNTVRRGVRELTERGLLTVRRGVDHRGRRVPSYIYQLHDPPSLTRSDESDPLTNDPSLDPTYDPKMDHKGGGVGSNFGSPHDPNLGARREKRSESKNNTSRRGDVNGFTTHQPRTLDDQIREQREACTRLVKLSDDMIASSGAAAAERVYPRRRIEAEYRKLQDLIQKREDLEQGSGWTRIGNEPHALLGQVAIGSGRPKQP